MPEATAHRVFVGGATGATGRAFVSAASAAGMEVVPHVRPQSIGKWTPPPEPAAFDLQDNDALDAALTDCTAAVCCIGTMRKRFKMGDTYQSSDIDGTRLMVEACVRVGVSRFMLVGALGTANGPGAYYQAKRAAESLVTASDLNWTIIRPASLDGNGREAPPGLTGIMRVMGALPGLEGASLDWRPIPVDVIGLAMVNCIQHETGTHQVLMGRHLWPLGRA